jgi:hypothetical protein
MHLSHARGGGEVLKKSFNEMIKLLFYRWKILKYAERNYVCKQVVLDFSHGVTLESTWYVGH